MTPKQDLYITFLYIDDILGEDRYKIRDIINKNTNNIMSSIKGNLKIAEGMWYYERWTDNNTKEDIILLTIPNPIVDEEKAIIKKIINLLLENNYNLTKNISYIDKGPYRIGDIEFTNNLTLKTNTIRIKTYKSKNGMYAYHIKTSDYNPKFNSLINENEQMGQIST